MMETNLPDSGFLTCFYYTGRHTTDFACGAREFVNRWSEAGPTHHMAAASGRHIDTILKVAKIFNVPVDVITR